MKRTGLWLVVLLLIAAVAGGLIYQASRGRTDGGPDDDGGQPTDTTGTGGKGAGANDRKKQAQRDPVAQAIAVAADEEQADADRLAALDGLRGKRLTPSQCEQVREIMGDTSVHASIRNNAVEVLIAQPRLPPGVVADLVDDWNNANEDKTWRDFTLQFMAKAYARAGSREQQQARKALLEAARTEESSSAGTAMLALERLGEVEPELRAQAQAIAVEVYQDGSVPARQITAVAIAARAGHEDLLPFARETAADTAARARLRTACIAAIGGLGNEEDVALLERLAQAGDTRVKQAAAYQLKELRQRVSAK
jgi:hypothetical protein